MGIKSKIKGSYAYTQWKLGKYTKRRVKNSCSPEWALERQQYERDRVERNTFSDNFYHNREIDTTYKMPPVKNNVESNVNARSARPMSTSFIQQNNVRREVSPSPVRYSTAINTDEYNRIALQKSDIDILVPSRNYTLVQKSNSSSVGYYTQDNGINNNQRYVQRNYSYTTNMYPPRPIDRRNI